MNPQVGAERIAKKSHLAGEMIPTRYFKLKAYSRLDDPGAPLTIYIEGDGRAWLSKHRLSDDPTPVHPLVLELASMDTSKNLVYLARPCQYGQGDDCDPVYWSGKRFSEEVIVSMNEAIDIFVQRAAAHKIHLVGYSGGAAVAVLIAVRRNDVASVRTIAGNLDHEAVSRHHGVDPLQGSLNPFEAAERLSAMPQRHFVGGKDEMIPRVIVDSFVDRAGNSRCVKVTPIEQATHSSGWQEHWPSLVSLPVVCTEE